MGTSRYGVKIRKQEAAVLKEKNKHHPCPRCGKDSVRREGHARWRCHSCNCTFAGGAYSPQTEAGIASKKALAGKKE
ncbi:50S ribosomal protein L37Ae [Candidatus Norongarragalina meridionalis]|nr:50S ribosomal protein L37Ae [Candidatus Norongarragalina meridionalis]